MIQVSCKLFAHMNELETTHAGSSAGSKAGAICERALKPCVPVSLCPCTILSVTLIWLGSNSTCLVRWGQTTQMVVLELLAFQPSRHGLAAFEHGNWQYLEECFAFWWDQQPQANASLLNLQSCNIFFRISANVGIYKRFSHQRSHWPWLLSKSICSLQDSFKCNIVQDEINMRSRLTPRPSLGRFTSKTC